MNIAPAFISLALAQLDARFGAGRVERGGLVILTSLDYDLQLQAVCALQTELAAWQETSRKSPLPTVRPASCPPAPGSASRANPFREPPPAW